MTIAAPLVAVLVVASSGAVTLDQVLASVDAHAPALAAAVVEVERTRAVARSASGAFDTLVRGDVGLTPMGAYGQEEAGVEVRQNLPFFGVTTTTGYRYGDDFPSYDGKRATSELGEVRAGVQVPLLRGLATDDARTKRETARLDVARAHADVDTLRVTLRARAASAWVSAVAARASRDIARDLLEVARARQTGIEAQVAAGAVAEIESLDNQRLILSRTEKLLAAERDAQRAAIALSFFLRDDDGAMLLPSVDDLPVLPRADGSALTLEALVDDARARRPELKALAVRRDIAERRLALAENDLLPRLTVALQASQDMGPPRAISGSSSTKNETEVGVRVGFELPVERRVAKGDASARRAELAILDHQRRLVEDGLAVEVGEAAAALRFALDQVDVAAAAAALATRLEEAERRRLELGQSTILVVNLREQQAAAARESLVAAEATALQARIALDRAVGRLLDAPPGFLGVDAPAARAGA